MQDEMVVMNLAQAEQWAAENGIRLTAADRDAISKAQVAEQRRLVALAEREAVEQTTFIERFNSFYPRFLESLVGVGDVLLTFTQTIIVAFGVPVVLVLLLIVEQQRVVHGIQLFERDLALATFAAWALVLLNLTLEFTIEYIENRTGYRTEAPREFSLRTWAAHLRYWLGWGRAWSIQWSSPAQRYKQLLRLVTFSILALALAGSMRDVIVTVDGAWYQALVDIVTQSNLAQMMTWLGGLLFAAAAVFSAQGLSRYVAVRCVEIISAMQSQTKSTEAVTHEQLDSVAVQYILAKVHATRAKQQEKAVAEVADDTTPFALNS